MKISRIEINNFRNIEKITLEPSEKTNVIYGMNAQGKTNLIEAVWMFSGHKSFRGAHDKELVNFDSGESKLRIEYFGGGLKNDAEIRISDKRNYKINGVELKSSTEMTEESNIIVFSPDQLSIIKDGPSLRRGFLNTAISTIYKTYGENLKKYNRILQQRNAVLKDAKISSYIYDMIVDYDNVLAAYGEKIIFARKRYIERLMEFMPKIFAGLTGEKEIVKCLYKTEGLTEGTAEEIKQKLKENRKEDIINGSTSVGPHRDDLLFTINDIDVRNFGSQGQQRSVMLALKLSEAELMEEISGEKPIALLDDVMSELDPHRQDYILNHIKDWQVFITCCEPSTIERMEGGKTFNIDGGKIVKE